MLDTETKRRIDTARDILVGKVPDPKSQVEQITIALIYKFMDDMDAQAEEMGGKRKFFAGDFARYGWAKLMRSGLGGHETLNLYAEAIVKMPENPGIPPLFRDIFKNAFLPYRDPETLRLFLKEIDGFEYDHSERLGDAFEYLLSVLGSQGEAGQFRTPRHIIDFIVAIVDPKKDDRILDPACGTAGFLISAYKHILRANSSVLPSPAGRGRGEGALNGEAEATLHTSRIPMAKGDRLSPDQRKKLADNFRGYDISPDMVRLSLVNMYLHGFTDPHVYEYDTLTSQDRWNEMADVILANPPFMSPKGGIKPHNRFSVPSKRSEVLFVDYMAEHLTPGGRAGIIVPEGIIFQSQTAYKTLRKMLVEQYLVAVVSLPAGVFNPYSGVKTSILILDKSLAKQGGQSGTVGFFKVENDGFNLGAQRRPIDKNDLPQVLAGVQEYLDHQKRQISNKDRQDAQDKKDKAKPPSCPSCSSMFNSLVERRLALIVPKEKIAANGDFNLSGERYRGADAAQSSFPYVRLDEVCEVNPEQADPAERHTGYFNYIDISCVDNGSGKFLGANRTDVAEAPSRARRVVQARDVLLSTVRPNLTAFAFITDPPERAIASTGFALLRAKQDRLLPEFLIQMVRHESAVNQMVGMMGKGAYPSINQTDVESIEIPLPPLEVQKEIVAEIEAYQKVIDGARAVLDHYRPHITINSRSPAVEFRPRLLSALDTFHRRDGKLVALNCNERAMTAKIAHYLQEKFPEWDVDHEYNRDGKTPDQPKRTKAGDLTNPDIIIHRRGTVENFAVIEVKKEGGSENEQRLRTLAGERRYQHAYVVVIDASKPTAQWLTCLKEPSASSEIADVQAWPMVELGELAENLDSRRVPITEADRKPGPYPYYGASGIVDWVADFIFDEDLLLISEDGANLLARSTPIAFSVGGKVWVNNHAHVLKFKERATQRLVEIYLNSISIAEYVTGSAQPKLNQKAMSAILIPLPPLAEQEKIVAEIEAEQRLVEGNRQLIERMEQKIAATLARIWGRSGEVSAARHTVDLNASINEPVATS